MKRYVVLTVLIVIALGALVELAESLHIPLLLDPSPWLTPAAGGLAAIIGVGLLLVDVALPVPSSLVMTAHGAIFGVVFGTLLSLIGSVGAALTGFVIGRAGGPLLAALPTRDEQVGTRQFLERWGALAIVVTRPVPILAETTAIIAGASGMRWTVVGLAALVGSLPAALLYAVIGAIGATFENSVLVFAAALLVAGCFWLFSRTRTPVRPQPSGEPSARSVERNTGRG